MAGDSSKDAQEAEDEMEDIIPDNPFIKFVHCVAWLLTVLLALASFIFMCYQISALYGPYCLAKLRGDASYRFPEYFYRVWGDDATDLTSEHWGYLGACALVTFISVMYVVPQHPFSKGLGTAHPKEE
mmetsp:Transcript_36038/g.82771  ORF Transcript_36038/g.82771 Transcript_36038/m.82771 type:complete len:128 (+) Transcript_36038:119-502(+)|eukprot:923386-Amphidinium_carterae.2